MIPDALVALMHMLIAPSLLMLMVFTMALYAGAYAVTFTEGWLRPAL